MSDRAKILPGSWIGVLGSGQLGRMFTIAARRMGYRVATFSPDTDTPTGQVADLEVTADYADLDRVREFARNVDIVTFEFENVPAPTAAAAAEYAPVRPNGSVLHTTQNRVREKSFLAANGFPVAPYAIVRSEDDASQAAARIGTPSILKTAGFGYDGKGQRKVLTPGEAISAWRALGRTECVLEAFVDFETEASIVAARGLDGSFAHYGLVENANRNHILDVSISPGRFPPALEREAVAIARGVLEALDVVGVLCVELFVLKTGRLVVNELAPRPHNSGHFSFDASITSQFEQQLRAICGLPLGATESLRPAAMKNLLGDLWIHGEPDFVAALEDGNVKLHLYGKGEAIAGRKMGHLCAFGSTPNEALDRVQAAYSRLESRRVVGA